MTDDIYPDQVDMESSDWKCYISLKIDGSVATTMNVSAKTPAEAIEEGTKWLINRGFDSDYTISKVTNNRITHELM